MCKEDKEVKIIAGNWIHLFHSQVIRAIETFEDHEAIKWC